MKIEWKQNENWYGPGAYLFYEIDLKNKLVIDIMCRFSGCEIEGYRSEIKVVLEGEVYAGIAYDKDLDVVKLKSLIKAKELGWNMDNIV